MTARADLQEMVVDSIGGAQESPTMSSTSKSSSPEGWTKNAGGHGGTHDTPTTNSEDEISVQIIIDKQRRVSVRGPSGPGLLSEVLSSYVERIQSDVELALRNTNSQGAQTNSPSSPVPRATGSSLGREEREGGSSDGLRPSQARLTQLGESYDKGSGMKRPWDGGDDQAAPSRNRGLREDVAADDSDAERDADKEDDGSDPEWRSPSNTRQILLADNKRLKEFYWACFRRIQQTACRQIAQTYVKVVHPKKQTNYPYNGAKRVNNGKDDEASTIPHWWPDGVPHKEPAHMKTPERMELLMHILCNLRHLNDVGPNGNGVCVKDLKKATDDHKACKISARARKWLGTIYDVRWANEQAEDGSKREAVNVHMPTNKRSRKSNRRRKVEDSRNEDEPPAKFEPNVETSLQRAPPEEEFIRVTRRGDPYSSSDSDSENDAFMLFRGSSASESVSTKNSSQSLAALNQSHAAEEPPVRSMEPPPDLPGPPSMGGGYSEYAQRPAAGMSGPGPPIGDVARRAAGVKIPSIHGLLGPEPAPQHGVWNAHTGNASGALPGPQDTRRVLEPLPSLAKRPSQPSFGEQSPGSAWPAASITPQHAYHHPAHLSPPGAREVGQNLWDPAPSQPMQQNTLPDSPVFHKRPSFTEVHATIDHRPPSSGQAFGSIALAQNFENVRLAPIKAHPPPFSPPLHNPPPPPATAMMPPPTPYQSYQDTQTQPRSQPPYQQPHPQTPSQHPPQQHQNFHLYQGGLSNQPNYHFQGR